MLLLCCHCGVVLLWCVLTLGIGQHFHVLDLLSKQQVSSSLQVVWSSHALISSAPASTSSSIGSLDLTAISITAGSLRHMGVASHWPSQVPAARLQVLPCGQQWTLSWQQTAWRTHRLHDAFHWLMLKLNAFNFRQTLVAEGKMGCFLFAQEVTSCNHLRSGFDLLQSSSSKTLPSKKPVWFWETEDPAWSIGSSLLRGARTGRT